MKMVVVVVADIAVVHWREHTFTCMKIIDNLLNCYLVLSFSSIFSFFLVFDNKGNVYVCAWVKCSDTAVQRFFFAQVNMCTMSFSKWMLLVVVVRLWILVSYSFATWCFFRCRCHVFDPNILSSTLEIAQAIVCILDLCVLLYFGM